MRIARVLTRLNLGGPARQVLASDPVLTERGHEIRIFAGQPEPGEGDLFDEFVARGLDVVRVPGLGRRLAPLADFRARGFLRRELRRFAPQIVHTHASKAGALGRSAARGLAGVARVHTFHGHVLDGYFPPTVSSLLVALERRLARETQTVIAVSHATAEDLLRLGVVDEERLVVVPPGIDLAEVPPAETGEAPAHAELRATVGAEETDTLVLVLGRLAEVKRPRWAVDVFEQLAERYAGLHLAFVGDGPERRALERRVREGGEAVQQRVHILGARADVGALLSEVDVVLATSRSEGMPVALIEAGAAGVPVVATPVGGVEELVAHERTGFLGESVDELAYHLAQLLDDPGLRRDMGHRARLRVEKRHSAEALASRLEAVYNACVGAR